MGREHATADRYGALVTSEEYRRSRKAKADVIWHLCGPQLSGPGIAADLGAGTGIIRAVLEQKMGKPLYGFEIDTSFVELRSRMVAADVERLPVADDSLEFVLMNHLYEHVQDPARLFREAHRVLAAGGGAYVSAGSRLAVIEPHYRLPFLSWLPRRAASMYLRLSGRGRAYEGIRFLTYGPLLRIMREAGFIVHDITERAIDELLERTWGGPWTRAWSAAGALPGGIRQRLLRLGSPQWFFLLEKPSTKPSVASDGGTYTRVAQ
ncbi:MAG: class I SAM-dependent methyltransferase [Gemmatimonadota bacterium]